MEVNVWEISQTRKRGRVDLRCKTIGGGHSQGWGSYTHLRVYIYRFFFVFLWLHRAGGLCRQRCRELRKGKGKHPPCHSMQEEAEEKDDVGLAGLPPARKGAQQQGREEAEREVDVWKPYVK